MRPEDLIEVFNDLVETLICPEAITSMPRLLRGLVGTLWHSIRQAGLEKKVQVDVLSDIFFVHMVYPALLVPDQYELVDRPLSPLARELLRACAKCLQACITNISLEKSTFACVEPLRKMSAARMALMIEGLAVDPEKRSWSDLSEFPAKLVIPLSAESDLGSFMAHIISGDPALLLAEDPALASMVRDLGEVAGSLQQRAMLLSIVEEDGEFTDRVDGVTTWATSEAELGLTVEASALRLCGEWIRKINQMRADLRTGLTNRVHPLQWNGCISDLVKNANFGLFPEFGKVLLRNLAVLANSTDKALELSMQAYKTQTQRDPLRDFVAILTNGQTILTRIARLSGFTEKEAAAIQEHVEAASRALALGDVCKQCLEMVKLHQMQASIVGGWSSIPRNLVDGTGLVTTARRPITAGRVTILSPPQARGARYAMLLSDMVILLARAPALDTGSSADARSEAFGSGNAFAIKQPIQGGTDTRSRQQLQRGSGAVKPKNQLRFRVVTVIPFEGSKLFLIETQSMFALATKGSFYEIRVQDPAPWFHAWQGVTGLFKVRTQDAKEALAAWDGAPRTPTARRDSSASPLQQPLHQQQAAAQQEEPAASSGGDEEDDEMAALMALGMYDTAVIREEKAPNEEDKQFSEMVDLVKRRDGKKKMNLLDLFTPPAPLVESEVRSSMRTMRANLDLEDDGGGGSGGGALRRRSTSVACEDAPSSPSLSAPPAAPSEADETEETALRAMIANCKITLRFTSGEYWKE